MLVNSAEFLASHVLKLDDNRPSYATLPTNNPRGRAKQFLTLNGKTIVVKDHWLYSNKGFKTLTQAQILGDAVVFADTPDNGQWLVYYISRPLVGTFEPVVIKPATLPPQRQAQDLPTTSTAHLYVNGSVNPVPSRPFAESLHEFPVLVRQAGLARLVLIESYSKYYEKPLDKAVARPASLSSRPSSLSLHSTTPSSTSSLTRNGVVSDSTPIRPEEMAMRDALEHVIYTALDALVQVVDERQVQIMLEHAGLTSSSIDPAIEKYIAEQLHEDVLFSRICELRQTDDSRLDSQIRKLRDIDIGQVGIPLDFGCTAKRQLALRLDSAVAAFKEMSVATSPQEMSDILLRSVKLVTGANDTENTIDSANEKQGLALTIDADTLVSMLMLVVIKSSVRHLNARLVYMRHFVFTTNVELGELGYALSTLEAVIVYLTNEAASLQLASRTNTRLWTAIQHGHTLTVKTLLQLEHNASPGGQLNLVEESSATSVIHLGVELGSPEAHSDIVSHGNVLVNAESTSHSSYDFTAVAGSLDHVFPFLRPSTPLTDYKHRKRKRVSIVEVRSSSVSSCPSSQGYSRRNSDASSSSNAPMGHDFITNLAQCQNQQGESLIMMAIVSDQYEVLELLLSATNLFPPSTVLEDESNGRVTLLCAALQSHEDCIRKIVVEYVRRHLADPTELGAYLARQDDKGRSAAHQLHNLTPWLEELGPIIPWTLKDSGGQTPLSSLCRMWDIEGYNDVVKVALHVATAAQTDEKRLHLDEHIDNKGNTLLHVVKDASLIKELLADADVDVNALNERGFSPLMMASKYGKLNIAATLFTDLRVETQIRDLRGLSATELAKDDEVRNRIDDLVFLSKSRDTEDRITTIVRSFFVDDGNLRMIIKSGQKDEYGGLLVTTCRRSLKDFRDLLYWLAHEQPASWLPSLLDEQLMIPFVLPSRPSRAVLTDIENRLDRLLRNLLLHTTFSTHELLWEFFLVPDLDPAQIAERSKRKAELRIEKLRDDYEPITDVTDVEMFVNHAHLQIRRLSNATRKLIRANNRHRNRVAAQADLAIQSSFSLSAISFLPAAHKSAYARLSKSQSSIAASPASAFHYDLDSILSATDAIGIALQRPGMLISRMHDARRDAEKVIASLARTSRWTPRAGFFDDARKAQSEEARAEAERCHAQVELLGSELRYTQQTVAAELAGWHGSRVVLARKALRDVATRTLIKERDRLDEMKRALRQLRK